MVCAFMLRPGSLVGSYRILALLAEGGMGAVYEGINESIERRVAIKVLLPDAAQKPEIVKRFFNEAWVSNRIDHPGLVQVHDHGTLADGTAYLVMELLKGETLEQRLRQGPLDVENALKQCWQIAQALAAAHERDIVHRDVKPGNLMLVPDPLVPGGERVKILDWGIAKLVTGQRAGLTASHVVIGTPTYMSPEQCRGAAEVDPKTDVYALGVILFEMLAGRPPFVAETAIQLQGMHLFQNPPSLAQLVPDLPVPDSLITLVDSLLAKEKTDRPTMAELSQWISQELVALRTAIPSQRSTVLEPTQKTTLRTPDIETVPVPRLSAGTIQSGRPLPLVQPPTAQHLDPPAPPTQRWQPPNLTLAVAGGVLVGLAFLGLLYLRGARQDVQVAIGGQVVKVDLGRPASVAEVAPEQPSGRLGAVQAASPSLSPPSGPHPAGVVAEPLVSVTPDPSHPKEAAPAGNDRPIGVSPRPRDIGPSRRPLSRHDEDVFRIAETHLGSGDWERAQRAALAMRTIAPERAWRIIGLCACQRNQRDLARNAWKFVSRSVREEIAATCRSRTGLPLVSQAYGMDALKRARSHLLHKKYVSALVDARSAVGGGQLAGWGIIGEIACIRRDLTQAREAYRSASTEDQKRIWVACKRNGVGAP